MGVRGGTQVWTIHGDGDVMPQGDFFCVFFWLFLLFVKKYPCGNNGRVNMADLSGDRETAVAIWMKFTQDRVSICPDTPPGLISTPS